MRVFWGYHLILDCGACDTDKVKIRETLEEFVVELVNRIEMKAYGKPILERFATHDPDAAGYSLAQLIETSSITGHFVDKNGDSYIDIFSFKPFGLEIAQEVVQKYLNPDKIKVTYLKRQA
ncbi:MAG: S-adenosylmethionine decarboxylase [Simkaniaceae bacterium]|nr:S-adenosylmethionine decarboxylase [Simkaniaceae bacterium]